MPSGMTGGSPAPASFDASLAARIGSFFTIGDDEAAADDVRRLRERALGRLSLREAARPSGLPPSARRRAGGSRRRPRPAASASAGGSTAAGCCTKLYVPYARPPPARMAMARTAKIRLRIVLSPNLSFRMSATLDSGRYPMSAGEHAADRDGRPVGEAACAAWPSGFPGARSAAPRSAGRCPRAWRRGAAAAAATATRQHAAGNRGEEKRGDDHAGPDDARRRRP